MAIVLLSVISVRSTVEVLLYVVLKRRSWAIFFLILAFVWQLYTLWLLVKHHEPIAGGTWYSRYMHLIN
ncbi:hypothetical protein PR202_ga19388 [Eleusine coracana subsp. coracana]|nr:hypothetical protein PR202_ga19388 [Eleusine coracana subsp. coracana]